MREGHGMGANRGSAVRNAISHHSSNGWQEKTTQKTTGTTVSTRWRIFCLLCRILLPSLVISMSISADFFATLRLFWDDFSRTARFIFSTIPVWHASSVQCSFKNRSAKMESLCTIIFTSPLPQLCPEWVWALTNPGMS